MSEASASPTDLQRLIENLVRAGTVAAVDHAQHLCRVNSGGLTTQWLPWFSRRAGDVRHWSPPFVGEQCIVLSPGGDMAAGMVLVGLYSNALPANGDSASVERSSYPDGGVIEHDHAASRYLVSVPDAGSITLRCGASSLVMDGNGIRLQASRIDLN